MSLRISVLEIKLFFSLTDMQGNIKALKYALNHELVYRDSAALLHKVGKPVPPYQKVMQCSVRTKFVLHICHQIYGTQNTLSCSAFTF